MKKLANYLIILLIVAILPRISYCSRTGNYFDYFRNFRHYREFGPKTTKIIGLKEINGKYYGFQTRRSICLGHVRIHQLSNRYWNH